MKAAILSGMSEANTDHFTLKVPFHSSIGDTSFSVDVFEAKPKGESRGLLIVNQEIFGVNDHIRSVARRFADLGFTAWAPAYFDAIEPGIEMGYAEDELKRGRELVGKLGWDKPLAVLAAAAGKWTDANRGKPAATIGYCWGGALSFLASTRLNGTGLKACVNYYGRQAYDFRNETPTLPLIMHYGAKDPFIPMEMVNALHKEHPDVPLYTYPAGHGFNRDSSHDYQKESSELAWQRTDAFLKENTF